MYSVIFFFGFATSLISCLACSTSGSAGSHGESGLIASKPGMPLGVNPVDGRWPPCAMLSMIDWRGIASDIARRCLTSGMFSTLNA